MFEEEKHYRVIEPEAKYILLEDYEHKWIDDAPEASPLVLGSKTLEKYVSFGTGGVTLRSGYQWNGSNIVVDSPSCMRASAVHDAWCRGMRLGILVNTEKNWDRGVGEYIAICQEDGLNFIRSRLRESFMKLAGELKFPS